MPNRIISPRICTSPEINEKGLGWFDEVLFYRLLVCADANGRFVNDPAEIKRVLFPTRDCVTVSGVMASVSKLQFASLINAYSKGGIEYLQIARWTTYQRIRSKGVYPDPSCDESVEKTLDDSPPQQRKEKERNKEIEIETDIKENNTLTSVKESGRFSKPSVEEIAAYCAERKNGIDAQYFFDWYESRGWRLGRAQTPVRDWRACVRTWERKDNENPASKNKNKSKPGFDLDEFFNLATGGGNK